MNNVLVDIFVCAYRDQVCIMRDNSIDKCSGSTGVHTALVPVVLSVPEMHQGQDIMLP